MKTANLAIMFTDIEGYTEKTSNSSRETTTKLLKEHNKLLMPIITHFHGRLVKTIGDAFLVVFQSPTAAVLCGTTIQDALFKYNSSKNVEEQIKLRVAINVGEVILTKGDVFGEAVNIASRVENITPAQEVYLTESVYLSMNKTEIRTLKIGNFDLKGIPEPVTVYCVPRNNVTPTEEIPPFDEKNNDKEHHLSRRSTAPVILTLPYGGQHLTAIESQILTPKRFKQLLLTFIIITIGLLAYYILPTTMRNHQWQQVEQSIGRGQIEQAQTLLDEIAPNGPKEAERFFDLEIEIATRLIERQEAENAAILLAKLTPKNFQNRATLFRLENRALEQLISAKQLEAAIIAIDTIKPPSETEQRLLNESRLRIAQLLLNLGRYDDLAKQLDILQKNVVQIPTSDLLAGHLHMALSQRGDTFNEVKTAYALYEKALKAEQSLAADELLLSNVAGSFEILQENEKQQKTIIGLAANLVDKYIGDKAITPLINQLENGNNNKIARTGLTNQIDKLGAISNVDHIKIAIEDLKNSYCNNDKNRRHTMKLIDRLRETGTTDVRALGALLKFAARQNGCQAYALQAIQRLTGRDIGFLAQSDLSLASMLDDLSNASCNRLKNRNKTYELLNKFKKVGDLRSIGPLLALIQKSPPCKDKALETVNAILGSKIPCTNQQCEYSDK